MIVKSIKPKKVNVTLNFRKGNNHPSPQSIVNPSASIYIKSKWYYR